MLKALNLIGYIILLFFTFLLFGLSLIAAFNNGLLLPFLLMVLILLALSYQNIVEFRSYFKLHLWNYLLRREDFYNFLAVLGGAVVTYVLSVYFQLGAVVASGLVGVLIALIKPQYGVPVYCGSFVGMASADYLVSVFPCIFLAGAAAGIIYVISGPFYDGFGGKLGTIAFAGCIIAGTIMGAEFLSSPIPEFRTSLMLMGYSIAAAVATFFLSVPMKHGPVLASGLVGLAGGLVLPPLHPGVGETIAVMVICSSFAGMSSSQRFPKTYLMVFAGFFSGLVFILSNPYLGGAGGKLGTIAFGSVISLRGIMNLIEKGCNVKSFPFHQKFRMLVSAKKSQE